VTAEVRFEDIRIVSASEVEVETQPGVKRRIVVCTYQYRDMPPRTLWIPREQYTKMGLVKAVSEDLKAVREPLKPT